MINDHVNHPIHFGDNLEDTYYGRMDYKIKPRTTLAEQMLTEHIKELVEREITIFRKELGHLRMEVKSEIKNDITKINSDIREIKKTVGLPDKIKKRKKKVINPE